MSLVFICVLAIGVTLWYNAEEEMKSSGILDFINNE